ncbi:MAG: trigger factor [Thomasclavelia sp.]
MSKVIKLGKYQGISVEVGAKTTVSEAEINREIENILAQNTPLVKKEGPVANGDITTIDFEGFKDGVAFEGGKASNHRLEIGSGQFIPGFEEQMIGMAKGETRDLNLTFPENYGVSDLAGADVVFTVTVHEIETKQEAVLNDEFVASLKAPNIETVEQLKESISNSLQMQHDQQYAAQVENAVLAKLIDDCEVEVNDEEVDNALNQQMQHLRMQLASQGMQLEQYLQMMNMDLEVLKQQLLPGAKQQAVFEAIIDEIVKVENLVTSDEEAKEQIEMIAKANQTTSEEILKKIELADLKRDLTRIKASRLILDQAEVTNK